LFLRRLELATFYTEASVRRWDAAALNLRGRPLDVLMGVAL
jgi:hypothetical protein